MTEVDLPHWQYCLRLGLGNLVLRMLRPIILKVQQCEKSVGELSITFANRVLFHTLYLGHGPTDFSSFRVTGCKSLCQDGMFPFYATYNDRERYCFLHLHQTEHT